MVTLACFLDETFEELFYDITTTVSEAVEQLAACIKLENYSTFTLYESRKVSYVIYSKGTRAFWKCPAKTCQHANSVSSAFARICLQL